LIKLFDKHKISSKRYRPLKCGIPKLRGRHLSMFSVSYTLDQITWKPMKNK
jgi:hypothetical protein